MVSFDNLDAYNIGFIFGIIAFVVLLFLAVMIPFVLTLQRVMNRVSPDLRKMAPGLAWLHLIPYFGMIWSFIWATKISESLAAEYERRNIPLYVDRPGFAIGIAFSSLSLLGFLLRYAELPFLAGVTSLAGLVCFILYWAKMAKIRSELDQHGSWMQQMQMQSAQAYSQQYNQHFRQPNPGAPYPPNPYGFNPPHYGYNTPPPSPYSNDQSQQQPTTPDPTKYMPPQDDSQQYPPPSQNDDSRWAPKP